MLRTISKSALLLVLTILARMIVKKYKPAIVGVIGNVGKTGTKEAIGAVLASRIVTRISESDTDIEFDIPLAILGETHRSRRSIFSSLAVIARGIEQVLFTVEYPQILVLELAAHKKGDIQKIAAWLSPDVTVITVFADVPTHIENFKNRDELIREKGYLVHATKKSGTVVYNGDDKDATALAYTVNRERLSYGTTSTLDIYVEKIHTLYEVFEERERPFGVGARVTMGDTSIPLHMGGVLGEAPLYTGLAALCVGTLYGVNMLRGIEVLTVYEKPKGRMRILRGVKHTTLIDDSHNASPKALLHAILSLSSLRTAGRKIAIIGDMLELGAESEAEHRAVGALVHKHAIDIVITVGKRALAIADEARKRGMNAGAVYTCDSAKDAGELALPLLKEGDSILVSGAQSLSMERVIVHLRERE